jgi:hypothetical protein
LNAAKKSGPNSCRNSSRRPTVDNTETVVESAAGRKPPILAMLERQGSTGYRHRPDSHDIVAVCPLCGGKIVISDSEKYLVCFGPATCPANRAPFEQILVRVR